MSGYDKWQKQFDTQIKLVTAANKETIEEAAEILKSNIEERTPVGKPELWNYPAPPGYVPGTLRASWTLERQDVNTLIIANDVVYGPRVEYGWSTQAPQGMMRISAAEWSSIIDRVAKNNKV